MELFPSMFTAYTIEPNLINGYVQYTSQDGSFSLTVTEYDEEYWTISHR